MKEKEPVRRGKKQQFNEYLKSLDYKDETSLIEIIYGLYEVEDAAMRVGFEEYIHLGNKSLAEYASPKLTNKIKAIHKLLFFTGGTSGDIILAEDPFGNRIYTKLFKKLLSQNFDLQKLDRNKFPSKGGELQEANIAIDLFNQHAEAWAKNRRVGIDELPLQDFLGPRQLPEPVSEVSDVVYNLVHMQYLDKDYDYLTLTRKISQLFGYSFKQTLALVISKYHYRYIYLSDKHVIKENKVISQLLKEGKLPIPSIGQLTEVCGEINTISSRNISPQLSRLTREVYDLSGREVYLI